MKWIGSFAVILGAVLLAGCSSSNWREGVVSARFLMEVQDAGPLNTVVLPVSGTRIAVDPKAVITEYDITDVNSSEGELGKVLSFQLTDAAARDLYRISGLNVGKRLVLTIDGMPLGARLIERPIGGGLLSTYVEVSAEELPKLLKDLKSSAVKIQAHLAKERQ